MEFGIIDITNGWFRWYLKDNDKSRITASRYTEEDFVKRFLVCLTEFIRDKKKKDFHFLQSLVFNYKHEYRSK